jgi:hypothetical protein
MMRVLRPGGLIALYEFRMNNPRSPRVRGVSLRSLERLFPGCRIDAWPTAHIA